jgi:hypothetical protein
METTLRINTTTGALEYWDGSEWQLVCACIDNYTFSNNGFAI